MLSFCVQQSVSVISWTRSAWATEVSSTSWAALKKKKKVLASSVKNDYNEPIWLHPEKLKFKAKKYFCFINVDRTTIRNLQRETFAHFPHLQDNLHPCIPFKTNNRPGEKKKPTHAQEVSDKETLIPSKSDTAEVSTKHWCPVNRMCHTVSSTTTLLTNSAAATGSSSPPPFFPML